MRFLTIAMSLATAFAPFTAAASNSSTAGIEALVARRLPNHVDAFKFALTGNTSTAIVNITRPVDGYTVSNGANGTIAITGDTVSALASGLRWYLTTYAHVDIYWYIGSRLHLAPFDLPPVNGTYEGNSIVPWRYHFNTVTFDYTSAWWTWDDWELQLDWMAFHGINLPLAWVGYEKILVETFLEAGFSQAAITGFLSGPAFQAWNRFGNIQGSWGGSLPSSWIDGQFELSKQIVARMVELGMTPVMPAFTGFVPVQIADVYPNASFVNGSTWSGFPVEYTNVTFLEPFDPLFTTLQKSFIAKQTEAYGNVSNIYTLDQYNENDPSSGDLTYLQNVTSNTIASLKAANPDAIWMIQGWLFYSAITFWTDDRVEAYLGGVNDTDMLILDLFTESQPQWQRTNNYYGKPWIWCELHGYGGNMGLYGQVENVTVNPIEALANTSSTMVGVGLTMEGQEGNEIMYDLLLDQAWSKTPIDTDSYFHDWVSSRYSGAGHLPQGLYKAWDIMRQTVYNNTNLAAATATTKSIFELHPNTTGLLNVTGHHSTTIQYNTSVLVSAWQDFFAAAAHNPSLWDNTPYTFDLTDITRQVLANAFYPLYSTFLSTSNSTLNSTYSPTTALSTSHILLSLLTDLDAILLASAQPHFSLPAWIASARAWSSPSTTNPPDFPTTNLTNTSTTTETASFYEYNARNQITLWGPSGQITDYASKQWGGLVSSYYVPRWELFCNFTLNSTTGVNGENEGLKNALLNFEEGWQLEEWGEEEGEGFWGEQYGDAELQRVIAEVVGRWPGVFA